MKSIEDAYKQIHTKPINEGSLEDWHNAQIGNGSPSVDKLSTLKKFEVRGLGEVFRVADVEKLFNTSSTPNVSPQTYKQHPQDTESGPHTIDL